MDGLNIYDRQKKLDLKIPDSVGVIGVGGVGSWVALNMALTGVKKIVLIDHDKVEIHNLNRTIFSLAHVGLEKVFALEAVISTKRADIEITPIPKKLEDLTADEQRLLESCEIIIDCRDTDELLPEKFEKKTKIVGGYDGFKVTLHMNRTPNKIWGDAPVRYTVTPSWLVPPQFLASLITLYICCPECRTEKEEVISFDIRDVFKKLGGGENFGKEKEEKKKD